MGGGPDDTPPQPHNQPQQQPMSGDEATFSIVEYPNVARLYPDIPPDPVVVPEHTTSDRVLYSRERVHIHPSSDPADDIAGRLALIETASRDVSLTWTPETTQNPPPATSTSSLEVLSVSASSYVEVDPNPEDEDEMRGRQPGQHNVMGGSTVLISPPHSLPRPPAAYATSLPLRNIYSLWIRGASSLTRGYSCLTVNVLGGASLPPFWFHDDVEGASTGAEEIIAVVRGLIRVLKSDLDPSLYLVDPTPDDEVAHRITESMSAGPSPSSSSARPQRSSYPRGMMLPSQRMFDPVQMDPLFTAVKEARWNILEGFSKITKFSRDTAAQILEHPLARPIVPHLPPPIQQLAHIPSAHVFTDDYDSARVYLAKFAASAQRDSDRTLPRDSVLRKPRIHGSVGELGQEVGGWEEETMVGWFEVIDTDTPLPSHTRTKPLAAEQWTTFFDDAGRLILTEQEVRARAFRGGVEHDIRIEVWRFLLGVYPWESSTEERDLIRVVKTEEYYALKRKWFDNSEVQTTTEFQDQKHRIDKDVHRTDRGISFFAGEDLPNPDPEAHSGTNSNLELLKDVLLTYNFYNTDLGYVQGMSDLLAPVFAVMGDEVMAFWGFVGFMERMKYNFYLDQSGMHRQLTLLDQLIRLMDPRLYAHLERTESFNLFFCFRWLLIWFKREFGWDDIMRLWEVLWTDHLNREFHLFVALAILDKHRNVIMDHLTQFDEILKYINDLAQNIDLEETLQCAEILHVQFRRRVEAVEKRRKELDEELSKRAVWTNEEKRRNVEEEKARLPIISEGLRELMGVDETGKGKTVENGLRRRGTKE